MVYAQFVVDGKRKTRFLGYIKLAQCDAVSIEESLGGVTENFDLNHTNCLGFGSDGASVITGCDNLASSQAAEKVPAIAQYQKSLSATYTYFSHSSVHTEGLTEVQRILEEPEIKMKRLYQVRWLSFDVTVDAVLRSIPALVTFF